MIDVNQVKAQIINLIEEKGPSLPIKISREISLSPVFTSAILSELINERKVKMSSLKIGSSPLYLIPGQEQKLENFSDELTGIEKTTFLKLKQNKILKDKNQEPAIRVALRSIKDFAKPLQYQEEIIWKYAFIPNSEIQNIIENKTKEEPQKKQNEEIQPEIKKEEKSEQENQSINSEQEKSKTLEPTEEIKKTQEESTEVQEKSEEVQEKPQKKPQTSPEEFLENAKEYLLSKDIEFLKEIELNKKDFTAIVRINSDLGKIKFLLCAKDKKRPNIADLTIAHQKASNEKMPCLFLAKGEPASTTKDFLKEHQNILKIEIMEN